MKCFIHINQEAVAACRSCGKGMCSNCSSYSNHSGVCPECRKNEFIQERNNRLNQVGSLKWEIFKSAFCTVLFAITIIGGVIFAWKWHKSKLALEENEKRIAYLTGEIAKLDKAISQRSVSSNI